MVSKINRDFFFATCRSDLFDGSLNQIQLSGLTALLNYWEGKYAARDDRWLAYVLATAYHEVDRRMKPINEYGTRAYFMRNYDKTGNSRQAAELGNTEVGDGPGTMAGALCNSPGAGTTRIGTTVWGSI
jgi:putative chitinase